MWSFISIQIHQNYLEEKQRIKNFQGKIIENENIIANYYLPSNFYGFCCCTCTDHEWNTTILATEINAWGTTK
ncbi:hypothetical protein DERP_000190 [Dermatophagoides pteronyssinus]|uniref:Uncharacterized protein n=1 Tax=Dermatophagoides pteronyssinus TaxID=6956 RepID=A0ABQ8IZG1_DERPT|nr:hypothetical protein DERP_000190 [Dermatophagoides pteronyssinus]